MSQEQKPTLFPDFSTTMKDLLHGLQQTNIEDLFPLNPPRILNACLLPQRRHQVLIIFLTNANAMELVRPRLRAA